jgi:hypothetical protein
LIRAINDRSPTWQQALLLLLAGLVIGYPSWIGATRGMWGDDGSPYQGLYAVFFFASAVVFLSGFASFLSIAVKALTSPTGAELAAASPPPAAPGGVSRATVVLAYFVWRPSLSRKGDAGLLISIFFGFAAYAVLTRIAVLILASRLRV